MKKQSLTRFAWLSISAAILTMALKTIAWWITGSVGLLSDALESIVNLVGGLMALAMLTVAERPADEDHPYGHGKAEYFSSGVEGTLILIASMSIGVAAADRLISPKPLQEVGIGLAVSVAASMVNFGVAVLLLRIGRERNSITLEANAHHLLTDVWTSVGVVAGVGLVALTGWKRLDPIVALAVAANIVWTGAGIVRRSVGGLMDTALPVEDRVAVWLALKGHEKAGVRFHALRTRQAGTRKFISLHVLVPGDWTVQRGHQLLERIENDIRQAVRDSAVFTHLESLDDPTSWDDETLDRWLNQPVVKAESPAVTVYNQGVDLMKGKQFAQAQGKFEQAVKLDPGFAEAYNNLAFTLRKQGSANFQKSLAYYNKAIQLKPKLAEAYMYRGVLYTQMGRKADAQADLVLLKKMNGHLAKELEQFMQTGKEDDELYGATKKK